MTNARLSNEKQRMPSQQHFSLSGIESVSSPCDELTKYKLAAILLFCFVSSTFSGLGRLAKNVFSNPRGIVFHLALQTGNRLIFINSGNSFKLYIKIQVKLNNVG